MGPVPAGPCALHYPKPLAPSFFFADSPAPPLVNRWHLWEHHLLVDGKAVPGAIFDFGVYFFHNAHLLLKKGNGPYFYRE